MVKKNVYAGVRLDGYTHEPVDHKKGEYVRRFKSDMIVTTNAVEGSSSLL